MTLSLTDLTFQYPGAEKPVFHKINFSLDAPGFHALFGASGVGKTSLARIIAGELNGFNGSLSLQENYKVLYTYNQERLPGWHTVGHFVDQATPSAMAGLKKELIEIFGLSRCMNLKFSQLSLGQKNRINLVRYLLQEFDLLILDESMANVDEKLREIIIRTIKKTFPDKYFIYISHNLMEIAKFSDVILVLRHVEKNPQARTLKGLNLSTQNHLGKVKLETAILEIMNAC